MPAQVEDGIHIALHDPAGGRVGIIRAAQIMQHQARRAGRIDLLLHPPVAGFAKAQRKRVCLGHGLTDGRGKGALVQRALQVQAVRDGRDRLIGVKQELLPEIHLTGGQRQPLGAVYRHRASLSAMFCGVRHRNRVSEAIPSSARANNGRCRGNRPRFSSTVSG